MTWIRNYLLFVFPVLSATRHYRTSSYTVMCNWRGSALRTMPLDKIKTPSMCNVIRNFYNEVSWEGFNCLIPQTGLDACFVGVPLDTGTSNRSGTRMGPRQIRCESVLLRPFSSRGVDPFSQLNVADIGDVSFNMYKWVLCASQLPCIHKN